jgi:hypothetical protein
MIVLLHSGSDHGFSFYLPFLIPIFIPIPIYTCISESILIYPFSDNTYFYLLDMSEFFWEGNVWGFSESNRDLLWNWGYTCVGNGELASE